MNQWLRETRNLLQQPADLEQVDLLYRDARTAIVLGFGIMVAILLYFWGKVPTGGVVVWGVLCCITYAASFVVCMAYKRSGRTHASRGLWTKRAAVFCFCTGVINGASSWVFYLPQDLASESLLHLALAGSTLGALVHLSTYLPALYAYAAGVSLVLMPRNLWVGDFPHHIVLFLSLLVLISVLSGGGSRAKTMADLVRTRNENRDLAEALRRENIAVNHAREQAERANKSKSNFFAAANHDLRQPLHALTLFSQTLNEHGLKADVPYLSRQILSCVDNLSLLFDELLDISRLDAGIVQPVRANIELQQLMADLTATHEPVAQSKGLRLTVGQTSLVAYTDRVLLLRVLSNLLSNAIRYTPQGSVKVRVERLDDAIGIHVQDTGIGIASDDIGRIFDEFYQIGNAERDRSRGLGLGLATVKRLSDLLTLGVTVQSAPGVGSTFSVFIPPAQAWAGASPAVQVVDAHVEDTLSGRKILVIDDEPQVRQGMHDLLTSWGHHVAVAASLVQASAHVEKSFAPDFIMADLRMADGESGIDTIRQLRAMLGRNIPAVLVSGDTQPEQLLAAKAAQLTLLHKPVKPAHLRALLNQVFSSEDA